MVGAVGALIWVNLAGGDDAPTDRGVCWREVADAKGERHFLPVSRNVLNLDSCGAQLEGLRLQEGRDIAGAYQGFFVFADDKAVASASTRDGFRYPIFLPAQRETIDKGLRDMIAARGGKAPTEADLAIDRAGP